MCVRVIWVLVCAACLQVLALVLTQGQRCLSVLSVLTDVRLQGGVRGLEAPPYAGDAHLSLDRMSTPPHTKVHTSFEAVLENSHMQPSAHTGTLDPSPPSNPPPALFVTISPSSSVLWGYLPTYSSSSPSIYRLIN